MTPILIYLLGIFVNFFISILSFSENQRFLGSKNKCCNTDCNFYENLKFCMVNWLRIIQTIFKAVPMYLIEESWKSWFPNHVLLNCRQPSDLHTFTTITWQALHCTSYSGWLHSNACLPDVFVWNKTSLYNLIYHTNHHLKDIILNYSWWFIFISINCTNWEQCSVISNLVLFQARQRGIMA